MRGIVVAALAFLAWALAGSHALASPTGPGTPRAAAEACLRERVPIAKREFQDQLRACGPDRGCRQRADEDYRRKAQQISRECARLAEGDQINTGSNPRDEDGKGGRNTTGGDRDRRNTGSDRIDTRGPGGRRPPGDEIGTGGDRDRWPPPGDRSPPPGSDPPPHRTLDGKVERICDLQRLAAWVFRNYGTDRPVATIRLTNARTDDGRPAYLVFLSGMEPQNRQQATMAGEALLTWWNVPALDAYQFAALDAVRKLPSGSTLILAGHSQGGMVAQNLVPNLTLAKYRVAQVLSYGAPITIKPMSGTQYLHVRASNDPVPAMDRHYAVDGSVLLFQDGLGHRDALFNLLDPYGAHNVYDKSRALQGHAVPAHTLLRSPCYEVDLTTLHYYQAPTFFSKLFAGPTGDHPRVISTTPRNPDSGMTNCLWVSLAQDWKWATDHPYWAECTSNPETRKDVEATLERHYGGRVLDDQHGPTSADALARHAGGRPVPSSRSRIEKALLAAGVGARGLVFVRTGVDRRTGKESWHIFNARNVGNTIQFFDAQAGRDGTFWFGRTDAVEFYRTN